MKRIMWLVFLCAAASCVSADAAPSPAPARSKPAPTAKKIVPARDIKVLAPADEYFGPLKMSIIGIRNMIRDAGLRYDVNHDTARQTYASAQLTERSIRDWEARFPHDDQLPRAVYFLQRLYTKVLTQESRDRARATATWLIAHFSASPQARQLKKTLVAEHLAPLPAPLPAVGQAPVYQSIFGDAFPSEFNPVTAGPPAAAPSPAPARPTGAPGRPPTESPRPEATPRASAAPPSARPRPAPAPARTTPAPARPTPSPAPEPSAAPEPSPAPPATASPAASPTGVSVLRGR